MCYEVFNRSAADNFLRAVRRDRRIREAEEGAPPVRLDQAVQKVHHVVHQIDWAAVRTQAAGIWSRHRAILLLGATAAAAAFAFWILQPSAMLHRFFGTRVTYRFPQKVSTGYLTAFKYDVKSWSERGGRFDTPVEEKHIEEIGNLDVTVAGRSRQETRLAIRGRQWIQITSVGERSQSRSIAAGHPSLHEVPVILNNKGMVQARPERLAPRVEASSLFILPGFPAKNLHEGQTWNSSAKWSELVGEYKIAWKGDFHWKFEGQTPCGADMCDLFSYTADLKPQVWAAPGWIGAGYRSAKYVGTAHGDAVYDGRRRQLAANTLERDGALRIPLADVGRIPDHLRIGRYVHGRGELVVRLQSKIEVRKQ